jgi:hypothetical protein
MPLAVLDNEAKGRKRTFSHTYQGTLLLLQWRSGERKKNEMRKNKAYTSHGK